MMNRYDGSQKRACQRVRISSVTPIHCHRTVDTKPKIRGKSSRLEMTVNTRLTIVGNILLPDKYRCTRHSG